MVRFFFFIFLIFFSWSKDFDVKISPSSKISTLENLTLTITSKKKISSREVTIQSGGALKIVGTSQRSSIEVINGNFSQKISLVYQLSPQKVGKFLLQVKIGKKKKSIEIEVTKKKSSTGRKSVNQQNEVFVQYSISDQNPYINQPVLIRQYLYFPIHFDVADISIVQDLVFSNLIVERLKRDKNTEREMTTFKNRNYQRLLLYQYFVYPYASGKIKFDGGVFQCSVIDEANHNRSFGSFFNFSFKKPKRFFGKDFVLNVKDYPQKNKNDNFDNNYGDFNFSYKISKGDYLEGQPITLSLIVEGKGNLKYFTFPKIDVEDKSIINRKNIRKGKKKESYNLLGDKQSGSVTADYYLLPNEWGELKIKPLELHYFSAQKKKYQKKILSFPKLNILENKNMKSIALGNPIGKDSNNPYNFNYLQENLVFSNALLYAWYGLNGIFALLMVMFLAKYLIGKNKNSNPNKKFLKTVNQTIKKILGEKINDSQMLSRLENLFLESINSFYDDNQISLNKAVAKYKKNNIVQKIYQDIQQMQLSVFSAQKKGIQQDKILQDFYKEIETLFKNKI